MLVRSRARVAIIAMVIGAAAGTLTRLPAQQQASDSTKPAASDTARPVRSDAPAAGPLRPKEWQRFEPQLAQRAAERALPQEGSMHTLRLSTLALILIGVIVLLLLVR